MVQLLYVSIYATRYIDPVLGGQRTVSSVYLDHCGVFSVALLCLCKSQRTNPDFITVTFLLDGSCTVRFR